MNKAIQTLCSLAAGLLAGCGTMGGAAYHCGLTGKDLAACCCTKQKGRLYCNETHRFIDRCCCTTKETK